MNKPNIFDHAKKELTQNAFICWLASWAKPECESVNKELHETGKDLIRAFLSKADITAPDKINSVCVMSQYKRIDVLLLVNDDTWILIENKTDTKDHSGQLEEYIKIVRKIDKVDGITRKLACIYFKTGDQSNYRSLEKTKPNHYHHFSRSNMIYVLRKGEKSGVRHPFYTDYLEHLQEIQDQTDSYKTTPIESWKEGSSSKRKEHGRWIGFYMALQEEFGSNDPLVRGEWGYVPNARGGFMGFWWRHCEGDRFPWNTQLEEYMQLEDGKLCFKIEHKNAKKDHREMLEIAEEWANELENSFSSTKYPVERATHLRAGKTMTVAHLSHRNPSETKTNSVSISYMATKTDGEINIEETIKNLNRIRELHAEAIKKRRE